jgi:hypothetical protein
MANTQEKDLHVANNPVLSLAWSSSTVIKEIGDVPEKRVWTGSKYITKPAVHSFGSGILARQITEGLGIYHLKGKSPNTEIINKALENTNAKITGYLHTFRGMHPISSTTLSTQRLVNQPPLLRL